MVKYLWKNGRRYYLYDTYDNWAKALKIIRHYKKKGCRYYIITTESAFWGDKRWKLYFDKVINLV